LGLASPKNGEPAAPLSPGGVQLAAPTRRSFQSSEYIRQANINCLLLFRHMMPCALALALDKAGNSNAARIAMMAMTTSNSINVKAPCQNLSTASRQRALLFFI